jgi:hypothetical protein
MKIIDKIDDILTEWSYKLENGTPDVKNKKHLRILEQVLFKMGFNAKEIIPGLDKLEGRSSKAFIVNDGIIDKIKRVWTSIKGKIKSLFSKVKNLNPGEETIITIPALKTEHKIEYMNQKALLNEGALAAIKGNYNEALTCQYVLDQDGKKGVEITPKYNKYRSQINTTVSKWDQDLKNAAGTKYAAAKKIIETGSKDMAKYLIGSVINEDAIIIGIYLDNLAFQGGVEFKADIQVAVMKEGKERLDAYSLKLYSGKSVGLANTSPKGLAGHLAGSSAKKVVEDAIKNDSALQKLIEKAKEADQEVRKAKKEGDTTAADYWRQKRKEARNPINPILAKITYKALKPYAKTPGFSENLLKLLGFADKETKMLMAVTTAKKSIIIDEHPDLDVSNIDLRLSGVSINVVGPTGKTIVSFGVKEGERKALSGKVSFADVEPVDLADYPVFEEE